MPVPQFIGKYQLEALIGEGGMGKVYKAFDPRMRRYLAIKILRQEGLGDPQREEEFKSRFFREGQICGRLNHPNIVTIYDMDEADEGLYIAMEYIQGQPIGNFIGKNGSFTWEQKLSLLQQIASALDYAHSFGVVHRDLKPSNILWSDQGSAKITDFGIAKLLEENESRLTRPGMFVGTPRYSSPEQIQGLTITSQSDVFSFGVLAFEVLTGVSPFPGSSISEILYKIAAGEVDYRPINSNLNFAHRPVREIFTKVFKTQPASRFHNAGDFFVALKECLAQMVNQPGAKMTPSETVRLERPNWTAPPTQVSPQQVFQDATTTEAAEASPDLVAKPRPDLAPPESIDNGDATLPPGQITPTMRIPRGFLDLEKAAEPGPSPKPPSFSPQPYATPDPSPQAYPPPPIPPSHAAGRKSRPPEPVSARYTSEDSPKPWWILIVALVFIVFLGFGWLIWPELKTLWKGKVNSQLAENTRPTFGFGHDEEGSEIKPNTEIPIDSTQTPGLSQRSGEASSNQPDTPSLQHAPEQEVPGKPENRESRSPVAKPSAEEPSPMPPLAENLPEGKPAAETLDQNAPAREKPPVKPTRGPVIIDPQITRRMNPVFPEEGRLAGIEGDVVLEAELRFDGKIGNISVLKMVEEGRYGFENAAVKALLEYQFLPGTVDGVPKTMRKEFSFQFRLQERTKVGQQRFAELADETLRSEALPSEIPDQGALQKPVFYKKVPPQFPEAGKTAGISGNVVLRATLGKDGVIRDIQIIQGLGDGQYGFEQAAVEAFKQWQFHPGKINGEAMDMPIEVSLQFKLAPAKTP